MIEVTRYPTLMSVAFILWWGPQSIDFVNQLNFMAYVLKMGYEFHFCLQSASLKRVPPCKAVPMAPTYNRQLLIACFTGKW